MSVRLCLLASCLVVGACGTLASPAGGDQELPSNRTGPFRELTPEEMGDRRCAAVDFVGLIDEPSALVLPDGRVSIYVTRVRNNTTAIARVVMRDLGRQAEDPVDVLSATLPWQAMLVSSPDVCALAGGGYAMAYATGSGVIGLARSSDGAAWQSLPSPALEGSPADGELTALRAPSLVCAGDGSAVLAYASAGSIWLARAPRLEGPWTKIDADPATPRRDPALGAIPATQQTDAGAALVGFESGALDDPDLTLEATSVGRPIWRLYYTARSIAVPMDGGLGATVNVSMAASFDGSHFARFGQPVFTSRVDATLSAPAALMVDGRRTMLYVGARCELSRGRRGIKAGVSPFN